VTANAPPSGSLSAPDPLFERTFPVRTEFSKVETESS